MNTSVCHSLCKGVVAVLLVIITLLTTCISISSFVIAYQNWSVGCDDMAPMQLPVWLLMTGIISLLFCFISLLVYFCRDNDDPRTFFGYFVLVSFIIVFSLNIVGSIMYFDYANLCLTTAKSLMTMIFTTLVFQWIALGADVIVGIIIIVGKSYGRPQNH